MTTAVADISAGVNEIWTSVVQTAVDTGLALSKVISDPEKFVRLSGVRMVSSMATYRSKRRMEAVQRLVGFSVLPVIAAGMFAALAGDVQEGGWLVPAGFALWWVWGRLDRRYNPMA